MNGLFISFCGLDGSGKTTQAGLLKDYFEDQFKHREVLMIPGYKPDRNVGNLKSVAQQLGNTHEELFNPDIISISLLYDLMENTHKLINPAVKRGGIVVTERYWESSAIYASLLGTNQSFIDHVIKMFPTPHLFIFLDIDPEESRKRVEARMIDTGKASTPKEKLEIMKLARERYQEFVRCHPNCFTINVEGKDLITIHKLIVNEIHERFQYRLKGGGVNGGAVL